MTRFQIADFGLRISDCGFGKLIWSLKVFLIPFQITWTSAMTPEQMKQRTKKFGIRTVRVVEKLPSRRTAQTIGQQLLRCGTSVGANYRAACRARSDAEFRSKLGICEEEADEAVYWLELIAELGYIKAALLGELIKETNEILAIIVASIKTSRRRR
jgi:four helix bundle protein